MLTDANHNLSENNSSARITPWTEVVRGAESEATPAVRLSPSQLTVPLSVTLQSTLVIESQAEGESTDGGGGGGGGGSGNAGKKPVWSKPNGVAVAAVEPMMGTHAWPALSETVRGSSTKSSSDSLKGLSDRSSSVSQGTATANLTSQKQVNNNGSPNSAPNHMAPMRQKSMKRNGGNTSNNGLSQPPSPQRPVVEGSSNNPSHRDHALKSGFTTHSHGGNDHPQQRGSFRNRNGNSHSRGDGSHHNTYGSRRDQDRGNLDWNAHRHFIGRDGHMQPQRGAQRFLRHPPPPPPPPPSSSQFIPPQAVQPLGSPIGFREFGSPVYYVAAPPPETLRGVPFVAPISPHALFFPAPDPQLHSRIVNQIDYYFSDENLIKDMYLRQNMDEQGWVPIKLIAGFKKVSLLTDSTQLILDAVRSSTVVEVQGDKIRRRNNWMRWIPHSFSNAPSPGKSSHDTLEQKTDQLNAQVVSNSSV